MATTQDIVLVRSDDYTLRFALAPPRSISGWSITFQVRDSLGGTSRMVKTVGSGITVRDSGKGIFEVAIAKGDTSGLTPGSFVWDCKRTNSGSNTQLAQGGLLLKQEVTT